MFKHNDDGLPAARERGLIVQELADELLVYDEGRHRAHCLNLTAALVWRSMDGRRSAAEIARRLNEQEKLEVTSEVVLLAAEQLSRSGLLCEPIGSTGRPSSLMTRRNMIKRVGIGAAVALPVVASIVAPRAAQAGTCGTTGAACTSSVQCCSGVCNGTVCT